MTEYLHRNFGLTGLANHVCCSFAVRQIIVESPHQIWSAICQHKTIAMSSGCFAVELPVRRIFFEKETQRDGGLLGQSISASGSSFDQ